MTTATELGQFDNIQFLRVNEVARRLGMSRGYVYKLMDAGALPFLRVGTARRISAAALATFVADHTVTT